MNLYNTKLISACPKQTPNSVRTPEVASRAMDALAAPTVAIVMVIVETVDSLILRPLEK